MKHTTLKEFRFAFLFAGSIALLLLASAYFLEHILKLNPCVLCIFQRFFLWGMAICFLLGFLDYKKKTHRYLYLSLALLFGIIGSLLAGRQIWLQHLPPDKLPSCTAGFEKLVEIYPLFEVFKMSFNSGECAKETFLILGMSLANWSFIAFIGLILLIVWEFKQEFRRLS